MIKWKIVSVDVEPAVQGHSNVVVMARWVCQASEGGKSAAQLGATALGAPGNAFVAYNDLTEQNVLDFCWASGLDRQAVEAKATADLQKTLESSTVVLDLPW